MRGVNVIAVYSPDGSKLLMCRRRKDPYKGKLNLVGGKIEAGEESLDAAYRELREETAITREEIVLTRVMDFTYYLGGLRLEVYAGRLRREKEVQGDENELLWVPADSDFFDGDRFAGEGNIGHMAAQITQFWETLMR